MKNIVSIINFETSNITNLLIAIKRNKIKFKLTHKNDSLIDAKALILPGVGSFEYAMNYLKRNDLERKIIDFYRSGKPIIGICLGMQIFFHSSAESKKKRGLNIIKKKYYHFQRKKSESVPFVGWHKTYNKSKIVGNYFFNHSYYCPYFDDEDFKINYAYNKKIKFCSYINYKNLYLYQFHPEISGENGEKIFKMIKKFGS